MVSRLEELSRLLIMEGCQVLSRADGLDASCFSEGKGGDDFKLLRVALKREH